MIMDNNNKKDYAKQGEYLRQEMMAVSAARLLRNEMVLVGFGLPMIVAILAKYTNAPELIMMTEAGVYNAKPEHTPLCVADCRFSYKTSWYGTPVELLGAVLPTRRADLAMLGGAQVDKYGSLNSTCIGNYLKPKKRLPGSGGACDFAALANRFLIIIEHDKRHFVDTVDYLTSPGWVCKKFPENKMVRRESLGMWGGPEAAISTMGVMKFHPETKEMYVESYYADLGVHAEEIKNNTGFDIDVSRAKPAIPPTYEELDLIRNKIDPEHFIVPKFDASKVAR